MTENNPYSELLEIEITEVDNEKYPDIKQKYRFEFQDIKSARK